MTSQVKRDPPAYKGMTKHVFKEGGFALWLPSDWRRIEMAEGHLGAIFTPYPDHFNTCIAVEKHLLPYDVKPGDASTLRKGLEEGLQSLPGCEIESIVDSFAGNVVIFDAKYSFLEDGLRRKRWLRNIYWNEAQLVVIAQGQDEEDYEYWMPMFFNTLMTIDTGPSQ